MFLDFREGTALDRLYKAWGPKRRAYQLTFAKARSASAIVLMDLARYCHASSPCNSEREQGRRDVWLHIQKHLRLSDEEYTVLMAGLTHEQRHQLFRPSPTFIEE